MKERPILYCAEMVLATLAGRKTNTRRVAHFKARHEGLNFGWSGLEAGHYCTDAPEHGWVLRARRGDGCWEDKTYPLHCPYGLVGDRLWVRETWRLLSSMGVAPYTEESTTIGYKTGMPHMVKISHAQGWNKIATGRGDGFQWRSPLFMPRWASRITLMITDIHIERLMSITEEQAKLEGVAPAQGMLYPHVYSFMTLWDTLNAKRGYEAKSNPWVWVIGFQRCEDQGLKNEL
jgi:hypothetical protein